MSTSSTDSSNRGNRGEATNVADCVKPLLLSEEMSDVQFAVGRQFGAVRIFPAHRIIMGARSSVFYTMFYGSVPQNCTVPIDIPDILPDAFANMLSYIYTDTVENLNDDNVFQTFNCADKYDLPLLMGKCTRFILDDLYTDNCLEILEKVVRYNCTAPSIMEECLRLIEELSEGVWMSDQFSAIGQETLQIILNREAVAVDENAIYTSVEKWAASVCNQRNMEASTANRREMLGPALYLVRFPLLTDTQLMDGPATTGLLLQSELWDIFRYKHATVKPQQLLFYTERRQSIGVINYTVPDVRELQQATTCSESITIRRLLWQIRVKKLADGESTTLGFFLGCSAPSGRPESATWTCQADAELRLLPWKTGTAPVKKEISKLFSPIMFSRGFRKYIPMEELLDPAKGYVNPTDCSLKLQIRLSADLPTGIE